MDSAESYIAALPLWAGRPELEPLGGGLSNQSFRATDRTGSYAVRLTEDFPFHGVVREREIRWARAAHAAGFAPEVVHAGPGVMVTSFIEGRTFTAAEMRARYAEVARLLRRFHAALPLAGDPAFDVFAINRRYAGMLGDRRFDAVNEELEAATEKLPPVIGHHDMLPANVLDDGRRLWLIDFEYTGPGTPLFDLANLSSNADLDAGAAGVLLETYFGQTVTSTRLRSHAAMECASLLREALWSKVSEQHLSAPGADYAAYAELNFRKLELALARHRDRFG